MTAALAALVVVAGFVALALIRNSFTTVSGDEGTFLAMIASLAEDGDLEFGSEDEARVQALPKRGGKALILQRTLG